MRNQIVNDVVKYMKSGGKDKVIVLRMVKGAILDLEKQNNKELTDEETIQVITKQIKTRNESIEQFKLGNRQDLIDKTQSEIDILNEYMPEQMSEEEIEKAISEVFSKVNPTSPKDMGKVMGLLMPVVKGKADMGLVNKIVKEKLGD